MVQILVLLTLVGCIPFLVMAHMQMKSPFPRRSPFNPNESDKDYNIMCPLEPHSEFKFPCRGTIPGSTTGTLTPGTSFPVSLFGSASHNGGHCQFSISYDGGHTFVSLYTVLTRCMLDGLNFNVPIPNNLPSGKAVFAWTWINASGKREMYMNCADVTVKPPAGHYVSTNKTFKGPQIVIANIPGAVTIGEFGAGADPRIDLYQSQPDIVIGPGLTSSYISSPSVPVNNSIVPTSTSAVSLSSTPSSTSFINNGISYNRTSLSNSSSSPSNVKSTTVEPSDLHSVPPAPIPSTNTYDYTSSSSYGSQPRVIYRKPRSRTCRKRNGKLRVSSTPSYNYIQGNEASHPSEPSPSIKTHTYMYI